MDEYSANAFVNRDEAIPVIVFDDPDRSEPASGTTTPDRKKGKRERMKEHGSNLKEKLTGASRRPSDSGPSMQDRLLEK